MTVPPADDVSTIAGPVRVEIDKVKGSRFICELSPAGSAMQALEFVDRIRVEEPDATHHCWAFRLESGVSRSSDDGEPGGTAGPPILRRLESAGLSDIVAVVTRYYGGTNLGTGGLIRAYGAAAAAAIDAASVVIRRRMVRFRIEHPYELSGAIAATLASSDADVVSSSYEATVTLEVQVPAVRSETFADTVLNDTAGIVTAELLEED